LDFSSDVLVGQWTGQPHTLLGDIGATNARFAKLIDGQLGDIKSFEVARFPTFQELLRTFLDDHCSGISFRDALLALAGPIDHGRCTLTNSLWVIDPRVLKESFGFDVQIVNDFQAAAYSLPSLASSDLEKIGNGKAEEGAPKVVLGPGSGLGVACLIEHAENRLVITSEGGHATLAGNSDREDAVIRVLRERFGHASTERAISGPGLENIFQAIASLDGLNIGQTNAVEITRRALSNECDVAQEALNTFCALLGSFAGNVALTFGARGGVYVAGGISPRILSFLTRSQFRPRFEAKGRFRRYLEQIPCYVIVHPAAAFLGLKFLTRASTAGEQTLPRIA
jgi:glucokinase